MKCNQGASPGSGRRRGAPAPLAPAIAGVSHATFTSGMSASFLVASGVALVGAAVGLLTRQGREAHGPAVL